MPVEPPVVHITLDLHNASLGPGGFGFPKLVEKVWGHQEVFANTGAYCLKRLVMNPGHRMSLHRHRVKSEHLVLDDGIVAAVFPNGLGGQMNCVPGTKGMTLFLPPGTWHSFYCRPGARPRVLWEGSTTDSDSDCERVKGAESGACESLKLFVSETQIAAKGAGRA